MPQPNSIATRKARVQAAAAAAGLTLGQDLLPTEAPAAPVVPTAAAPVAAPAPVAPAAAAPVATPVPAAPVVAAPAAKPAVSPEELAHLRHEAAQAAKLQADLANQAAELEALRQQVLAAPPAAPVAPAAPQPDALKALQEQLAAAHAELAAAKAPKLSAETWSPDSPVDFTQAQALWTAFEPLIQSRIDAQAREIAAAQAREVVQPLQQQMVGDLASMREMQTRQARSSFEQRVVEREPLAPTLVNSVAFKSFLATPVPYMAGLTHAEVFQRNIEAQHLDGVLHVINAYKASLPAADDAVDVPAAAGTMPVIPDNASTAPQVEDLSALRTLFRQKRISATEFRTRLAAAEQAVRQHQPGVLH